MRNVVPQYKKQIAYMKQQLAVAMKAAGTNLKESTSSGTSGGEKGSAEIKEGDFKLPLIK